MAGNIAAWLGLGRGADSFSTGYVGGQWSELVVFGLVDHHPCISALEIGLELD